MYVSTLENFLLVWHLCFRANYGSLYDFNLPFNLFNANRILKNGRLETFNYTRLKRPQQRNTDFESINLVFQVQFCFEQEKLYFQ